MIATPSSTKTTALITGSGSGIYTTSRDVTFAVGARGFLHWGFDYWYSQLSEDLVDPYQDTTAGGAFPAGDAFIVYPGPSGVPWESIRHRQVRQSVQDHRALQLLRDLAGQRTGVDVGDAERAAAPVGEERADHGDGQRRGAFDAHRVDPEQHLLWRWRLDEAIDAMGSNGVI
ncbi:DUF4091 domain-containing protein [Quadrisphaera setariae]|uniref:DUF4091 domain-containing protein n=1 Tax=Quadrisphaera setariae TaxID=2593304 RepID=A0A5C8Z238_9ACTN|nr:DUF4091 domain-containing protein [Quadrisphaera setariae]TXR51308.1 DUF4091 domain-containing protein [Quadrisphaera setariae]